MRLIDAVGVCLLLGMVGLFGVSFFFDRHWWTRCWRGLLSGLDPLRVRHWTLRPLAVLVVLIGIGAVATVTRSIPVAVFWGILVVVSVSWFLRARYQHYRYRKALGEGFAVDMTIWETYEEFGLLDRWAGSVGLPKRSILVAGAPGSGKTEAAKHLVQQMLFDESSLILVYDHKTDFQAFFDELDIEYIRISMDESTYVWNLFQEFESEQDADEFARALFPELSGGDNDFFDDMARQVFAACLKMMMRRKKNGGNFRLSNATVRVYFQEHDATDIYEDLHRHSDLRGAASAINVEASPKQAQGVYASVQRIVNKVFVGDFGARPDEREEFSLREYVQAPQGVPIVLDYPKAAGQSTKPIFRFLIDHAAMFAMEDAETQSYFVLDEFAQIPHLRRLEELVNVGRGEQVTTLVTLQSVQQLYRNYDRSGGEAILAGLVSMVLLRPNDAATTEFYRSAIGTDFTEYTQHVEEEDFLDREQRETKDVEEHPFSTGEIRRWDPGVGVVVKQSGWLHGYISMLTRETMAFVGSVLTPTDQPDALSGQQGELPEQEVAGELDDGATHAATNVAGEGSSSTTEYGTGTE
jgi:hypothetical protein